jgi:D-3-phosphoglycerate dehydrogenase
MQHTGIVLIAAPVHPVLTEGLVAGGYELRIAEDITPATAPALIADCTGVVTSLRLKLDRALIDSAPGLKWIGRMGSGMEIIDTEYARRKGIVCFSSPEGNSNAVAEHALGMLLTLIRRIAWSHREIQEGLWRREANRGIELEGRTIGIIGFGHTGSAFARKLQGFDVRILAYDTNPDIVYPEYVKKASLSDIQQDAEVLSFHVPLAPDTRHYFNRAFAKAMQQPFFLLNTSRGSVVDLSTALEWLEAGRMLGMALDVLEPEPLAAMEENQKNLLLRAAATPGVILTPHIGGYSREAVFKMSRVLLEKIKKL